MTTYYRLGLVGARRLLATPAFTLFAILSLGIGAGSVTAAYSVLYPILWKPLGIHEPARVVFLRQGQANANVLSWSDYGDLAEDQRVFHGLAASQPFQAALVRGQLAEGARGEAVNGEYFSTLGVGAVLGRALRPSDNSPGAPGVAVVSEGLWRKRLGADRNILGSTIRLAGATVEVVGVAPSTFRGFSTFSATDVWVAANSVHHITGDEPALTASRRGLPHVSLKARLRETETVSSANAYVSLLGQRLDTRYPPVAATAARSWSLARLEETHAASPFGLAVLMTTFLILLIACTNVASLSFARASSRGPELAVRVALGASRWDLIREQLVESSLVASAGVATGTIVAHVGLSWLAIPIPVGPGTYTTLDPELSVPIIVTAFGSLIAALAIAGVWPAWALTTRGGRSALTLGEMVTPIRWRAHRRLISCQVAVSVCLFLVAFACIRFVSTESRRDAGVDMARLSVALVDFRMNGHDDRRARTLVDAILRETRAQPTVSSTAASVGLPFGVLGPTAFVSTSDRAFAPGEDGGSIRTPAIAASPTIFDTLGVSITAGRTFDAADLLGTSKVVILSESLARSLFGSANVIGSTVWFCERARPSPNHPLDAATVVGVAANTDVRQIGSTGTLIYMPLSQFPRADIVAFTAKGRGAEAVQALERSIYQVDSELVVSLAGSGMFVMSGAHNLVRVVGALATLMGVIAVVLALIGLYGILSHAILRRKREFGIRLAVGAEPSAIIRAVIHDGLRPVIIGVSIGLAGSVYGSRALQPAFSQQIASVDPLAFALVAIPVLVAALAACYLPARRAAQADPTSALREQ